MSRLPNENVTKAAHQGAESPTCQIKKKKNYELSMEIAGREQVCNNTDRCIYYMYREESTEKIQRNDDTVVFIVII